MAAQEGVMSPYTKFGIDTSRLIGWYGQTEVKLKNPHDNFCEAWFEDAMCQVPWKSDNLRDLKCFLKVFDKIKNGGEYNKKKLRNELIGFHWIMITMN